MYSSFADGVGAVAEVLMVPEDSGELEGVVPWGRSCLRTWYFGEMTVLVRSLKAKMRKNCAAMRHRHVPSVRIMFVFGHRKSVVEEIIPSRFVPSVLSLRET